MTILTTLVFNGIILAGAGAAADGGESLDAANRRWSGAHCRTRQLIEVKKKRPKDGWSRSEWLWWGKPHSNQRARVWFSDAEAVKRGFGGRMVPVGTELVARGWTVEDGDLFLELELANMQVGVRVFIWDDWVGRVSGKRIEDFERWARFDLFELLSSPEEELVDVAVAAPDSADSVPAADQPVTTAAPRGDALSFGLRVLSASVEPVRTAPGQEVQLVAVYDVSGVAPGSQVEVVETRTIFRDGVKLTSIEARARRGSGAHESRQPLRLPATVEAGVYELEVSVAAAGLAAVQVAIFEVR